MNVTPQNAVAVTPGAWDDRAARQRLAERLGSIEHIILRLMTRLETQVRRAPAERITEIVNAWAGPLARFITVDGVRRSKRGSGLSAATSLILRATNPIVIMELRPRLPALLAQLKQHSITDVRFT